MPCLRITIPGHGTETHIVSGERVTVGRRPENTIQILDRSVSAFHAELLATHGHYRLRDLKSTNHCFVAGQQVAEYHLRERCRVAFGNIECDYDPAPTHGSSDVLLSRAELEHDLHFLRSENVTLRETIRALERRIDIVSSAQIIGAKRSRNFAPDAQSDAHTAAVEAELEQTREELAIALRARDAARAAAGMLHSEKTHILRGIRSSGIQRPPAPVK